MCRGERQLYRFYSSRSGRWHFSWDLHDDKQRFEASSGGKSQLGVCPLAAGLRGAGGGERWGRGADLGTNEVIALLWVRFWTVLDSRGPTAVGPNGLVEALTWLHVLVTRYRRDSFLNYCMNDLLLVNITVVWLMLQWRSGAHNGSFMSSVHSQKGDCGRRVCRS